MDQLLREVQPILEQSSKGHFFLGSVIEKTHELMNNLSTGITNPLLVALDKYRCLVAILCWVIHLEADVFPSVERLFREKLLDQR